MIDIKTSQWLNDKKMNIYLRPKTLFNASNFESYLNEIRKEEAEFIPSSRALEKQLAEAKETK